MWPPRWDQLLASSGDHCLHLTMPGLPSAAQAQAHSQRLTQRAGAEARPAAASASAEESWADQCRVEAEIYATSEFYLVLLVYLT